MKKKYIIITGGAGFIGSNLIERLIKITKLNIISLDNYSTGKKENHIKSPRVQYIKGHTKNFKLFFNKYKNNIHTIFHFGEFARIFQSFRKFEECYISNVVGTKEVLKFGLDNDIRIIYSATSASLGNDGEDKNLSPYAFTKSKNIELLENLKKWYGFRFDIIYFYNVYGPKHISKGEMATVIGIFERQSLKKMPLTVVKPGTQSRKFTHVWDTIDVCIQAWKKNKCKHYSVSSKESFSIIEIAKMFGGKIKYLPHRAGERFKSAIVRKNLSNKIIHKKANIKIKDYIKKFKNNLIND